MKGTLSRFMSAVDCLLYQQGFILPSAITDIVSYRNSFSGYTGFTKHLLFYRAYIKGKEKYFAAVIVIIYNLICKAHTKVQQSPSTSRDSDNKVARNNL